MYKQCILALALLVTQSAPCQPLFKNYNDAYSLIGYQVDEYANNWIDQLPQLSQEELMMLADFLYYSYWLAFYESGIRIATYYSYLFAKEFNENIDREEVLIETCKTHKRWQEIFEELIAKRSAADKAWKQKLETIQNPCFDTLKTIINNLQGYGQEVILQIINDNRYLINKQLDQYYDAVDANLEIIDQNTSVLNSLRDEPTIDLDVQQILWAASNLHEQLDEITSPLLRLKQIPSDMLIISTLLFYNVYQQVCSLLEIENLQELPSITSDISLTINVRRS